MKRSGISTLGQLWILFAAILPLSTQAQVHSSAPSNPPQSQAPIAVISSGTPGQIVPPPPNYHYPNGQTYVYSVEWHLFNAGTSKVTIDSTGGQEHVTAIADSAGVVTSLYKVHDHFEAFFDPKNFCSLRISKHTEEGSHSRQSEASFDYNKHKSVLDEKNLKTGETKHVENDLPTCVTDVVSGFYYLSSLPLQVGTTDVFSISDGGKTTEVTIHVEAKEKVKVPAGTYETVRVKAEATSGSMKGKGTVWAWFTDDGNHTPIQMRSKLGWGTLLFQLQRIDK
jgi:hypothetical protein